MARNIAVSGNEPVALFSLEMLGNLMRFYFFGEAINDLIKGSYRGLIVLTAVHLVYLVIGTILGSILFRLLVAVALRMGLEPNDLKLITAAFVLIALVSPALIAKLRRKPSSGAAHA